MKNYISFNKNMANSPTQFFGTVMVNNEPRGHNSTSFHFSLQSIMYDLAMERHESVRTNGYVYYIHEDADFRDHDQYLSFCKRIIAAYKKEEAAVLKRKAKRRATRKAKGDEK